MSDERYQRDQGPATSRSNNEKPHKKRRRRSSGTRIALTVVMILIVCCFTAWFSIISAIDLFGFNKPDQQIEITIERGMSLSEISNMLEEKGVIANSMVFQAYSSLRDKDAVYQAGSYILNSNMGYDMIRIALKSGDTIKEEVTITFYEGMTVREIAALLQENDVCSATEFINCLETEEFDFEFINMIPNHDLRFRKLEGYLFPDTYDFFVGENVTSVAKKFLRNFQNRVFPELYEEIRDSGMTLDDAVILASVIQEEASVEEHMRIVSSVFRNRMEIPSAGLPMLQSDVTIFYVEKNIKPYQTHTNQEMYDAYNTYVCKGLPVGPISSPGLTAIKAAINPDDTDYFFFVTDANGKYYYSETLSEHNTNVRKAAAVKKES